MEKVSHLHNPYAGVSYAWQLTETVGDFLKRLPPATTNQSEEIPWIFVCNPYIPRVQKSRSKSQLIKGNEDEAPDEEGSNTRLVAQGGLERLQIATDFIQGLEASGKSKPFIEKEIRKERKQTVDDILLLAHTAKVRAGKVKHCMQKSQSRASLPSDTALLTLLVLVAPLLLICRSKRSVGDNCQGHGEQ